MKKVLLTGVNGQLGTFILKYARKYADLEIIPRSRKELDLSHPEHIQRHIIDMQPDVIINASAYTNVDKAEEEKELAMAINGYAVGELAKACETLNSSLIQISTDYVFDGEKEGEYLTTDTTAPINHYGVTKLMGERLALNYSLNTTIIRTSRMYSNIGLNFQTKMTKLFHEKEVVKVVNDQIARITPAQDLAAHILKQARKHPRNEHAITHFAGTESMSWYQFAEKILRSLDKPMTKEILPISTSDYPTLAKRPKNSVLSISL